MYRIYNARPTSTSHDWFEANRQLLIQLLWWSLLLAAISASQRVSSEGWYSITEVEGAVLASRELNEATCKAEVPATAIACIPAINCVPNDADDQARTGSPHSTKGTDILRHIVMPEATQTSARRRTSNGRVTS